jgi:hypothetical protein
MSGMTTVRIEDEYDRWRFVCPNGHRSWEPTNNHFWCHACARTAEVDGVFHELHDKQTGDLVARDRIELVTPGGPYEEKARGD